MKKTTKMYIAVFVIIIAVLFAIDCYEAQKLQEAVSVYAETSD